MAESSDLRERILETTRHLLVREGYKSVSMRKIARAIGYSATSIYLHFENKDALFHALIDEGIERLHQTFKAVAERHLDPLDRLRGLCRCYIEFGLKEPETYEIMFMLHTEHMRRYPAENYRRARRNLELFAEALEEGRAQGKLRIEDARVSATATWAALHGTVSLLIARRVDVRIDREVFIETAIDQALHGILHDEHSKAVSAS